MAIFGFETFDTNDVELLVGGTPYKGWESVSITKNLDSVSGSFSVAVMDRWRELVESWGIKPGDECSVTIGGEVVITGWVDGIDTDFDKESRSITVKGRDKTCDLVDCSIITKTSQLKNKTLTDIATELCSPFSISVTAETDVGKPFEKWDITQGETVFDNLNKAAKLRGVLLTSDERGNLKIVRAGSEMATDALVQGENILSASASYDDTQRFSEYVVKGQKKGDDKVNGKEAAHNKDQATDAGVSRYRPMLLTSEGSSDKETVKGRAEWEATTRAAKAFKMDATVVGWRQSSGTLWKVNQKVQVTCGFAGVINDLLISGITYEKSEAQGTVCRMELVRPDAFKPEPEVKEQSDPSKKIGWSGKGSTSSPRPQSWWGNATKV